MAATTTMDNEPDLEAELRPWTKADPDNSRGILRERTTGTASGCGLRSTQGGNIENDNVAYTLPKLCAHAWTREGMLLRHPEEVEPSEQLQHEIESKPRECFVPVRPSCVPSMAPISTWLPNPSHDASFEEEAILQSMGYLGWADPADEPDFEPLAPLASSGSARSFASRAELTFIFALQE